MPEHPTSTGPISGVVLSAGSSTRLGRPKQLLPLRGRPLLQHVLDAAAAADLHEVVVVLGHRAAQISEALVRPPRGRVVVNPAHDRGQSTSLRAGLAALGPEVGAALVLLGDQPEVRVEAIRAVRAAWEAGQGPVVRAAYGGRPGHPLVLDRSLWPAIAELEGDLGAREAVRAHPDWVAAVEVGGEPPPDVDTEKDYERLLRRAG
jgi:molybdenum cofactor cytidylyltransferase